jgi:hypothetical protein
MRGAGAGVRRWESGKSGHQSSWHHSDDQGHSFRNISATVRPGSNFKCDDRPSLLSQGIFVGQIHGMEFSCNSKDCCCALLYGSEGIVRNENAAADLGLDCRGIESKRHRLLTICARQIDAQMRLGVYVVWETPPQVQLQVLQGLATRWRCRSRSSDDSTVVLRSYTNFITSSSRMPTSSMEHGM